MIIPVFLFAIVFSLFAIDITDSAFADERICKQDAICVKTGDFLKYEMTGVPETKYSFNETVDENKINLSISGFDGDEPTYEVQFILDMTNGDTFEVNNPDEKYSSLIFMTPIPMQMDSVDVCENLMISDNLNLREVLICETNEDEGELRIVYDEKTGILLEMTIKTETYETYSKLLETNIFDDKIMFESEDALPVPDNDTRPTTDESQPVQSSASIVDGKLLSPKKQVSQGIEPENIQCKESLVLFLRDNGQPICIKPTTMQKLVERQQID